MNKKVLTILCVALLFLEGVVCISAEEPGTAPESKSYDVAESTPDSPLTTCGEGNGGGGNPV